MKTIANRRRKILLAKSLIFSAAAFSMAFSIYLFNSGATERGIFVGIWVPSILAAGTLLMVGPNE